MYKTILFDLDGTLTDPQEGITKSVQYALRKMNIVEDDLTKLTSFIGPPLLSSFKEMYNMNKEALVEAIGYYRERFAVTGLYENRVYCGIPEMLQELRAQGKKLIVATSKPTVFSVQILQHFDLERYFDAVIGSNLDGTRVEKAEVIEFALAQLAPINRQETVMVGDRKHDVIGAQKNGIDAIGVTYGYGGYSELAAVQPTHIVTAVHELVALLGSSVR